MVAVIWPREKPRTPCVSPVPEQPSYKSTRCNWRIGPLLLCHLHLSQAVCQDGCPVLRVMPPEVSGNDREAGLPYGATPLDQGAVVVEGDELGRWIEL